MPNTLEARVAGALTNVRNPRVDNDVITDLPFADMIASGEGIHDALEPNFLGVDTALP